MALNACAAVAVGLAAEIDPHKIEHGLKACSGNEIRLEIWDTFESSMMLTMKSSR